MFGGNISTGWLGAVASLSWLAVGGAVWVFN